MDCAEARERLLEADLEELRTEGGSPLAMHLMGCTDCRKAAEAIAGAESAIASVLERQQPASRFAEAVDTASRSVEISGRSRKRWFPLLLPLAAAAALFILLLPLFDRKVESPIEIVVPELQAELPAVKAPPGKSAMILDTGSPDFQIIWLF